MFIGHLRILQRRIEFSHLSTLGGGCQWGRKLRFGKVTFSWKDSWHIRDWAGAPPCSGSAVFPCSSLSLRPEVNRRVMNIYAGSTGLSDAAERRSDRSIGRSSDLFQTLVIFSSSGGMKVITSAVAYDANNTQTCLPAPFWS